MSRTILDFTPDGLKRRLADMEREIRDLKRIGAWNFDREYEAAGGSFATRNNAQLLVMTVAGDSIASGGDYVAFTGLASQHGFPSVSGAGDSWTHETGGVYMLTYEHAWDTYADGGTIALELDGVVQTSNVIGDGSGQAGRGTIAYVASEGQVGKIKVTQSSGSAQTCSATVWIALPDPTDATPSGSASVQLYIDDVLVASASGDVGVSFSSATILLGEGSSGSVSASVFNYDDVTLTVDGGANLVANSGFESALLAGTASTAVASGNWRRYQSGGSTADSSGTTVYAGSLAGRVAISAGFGNQAYLLQDVALAPGDPFDLVVRCNPASGSQNISLRFDWDRSGSDTDSAVVAITPTATSFVAFGLSGAGPAIPQGSWSKVTLRVGVEA